MTEFKVTISEMHSASGRIAQAAGDFLDIAGKVLESAEALGNSWEGDSQKAFIAEQRTANQWYKAMVDYVNEHVRALDAAADGYQEADNDAAAIILGN